MIRSSLWFGISMLLFAVSLVAADKPDNACCKTGDKACCKTGDKACCKTGDKADEEHLAGADEKLITNLGVRFTGTEANGNGSTIDGTFYYKKEHPVDRLNVATPIPGSFTFTGSPDQHQLKYVITRADGTKVTRTLCTPNKFTINTNFDNVEYKKFDVTAEVGTTGPTKYAIEVATDAITDLMNLPDCSLLTAGRTGFFAVTVNGQPTELYNITIVSCN